MKYASISLTEFASPDKVKEVALEAVSKQGDLTAIVLGSLPDDVLEKARRMPGLDQSTCISITSKSRVPWSSKQIERARIIIPPGSSSTVYPKIDGYYWGDRGLFGIKDEQCWRIIEYIQVKLFGYKN